MRLFHLTSMPGKITGRKICAAVIYIVFILVCGPVYALPEGGEIVAGNGNIQTPDSATTIVTQQSESLSINWDSLNIAKDEQLSFIQPGNDSIALNYILDHKPSEIYGRIYANGRIFLMNPNGIIFGEGARINVGALAAGAFSFSTNNINSIAGLDGQDIQVGPGSVNNAGEINVSEGGSVTLIGNSVLNEGNVQARLGKVHILSAGSATLSFDGDGLIQFEVSTETLNNALGVDSAIKNTGEITVEGGYVVLESAAANDIFSNVVNNEGLIEANRINNTGGVIRLEGTGGNVINNGTVDASGTGDSAGGTVALYGDRVGVFDGASIDASGETGGGNVYIGGQRKGTGDLVSEFTQVSSQTSINADALSNGDGGEVVIWADNTSWAFGEISAKGGTDSGNGGFVEISGKQGLVLQAEVDVTAANGKTGTLLLDPTDIVIHDGNGGTPADEATLPDLTNGTAGPGLFNIDEVTLEGLAMTADLVLEATNNITINDLTDNVLAFPINTGGSITIAADTDANGTGAFTMNTGDTISTQGGSVTITGAGVTLGSIDTDGPVADNGTISVTSSASVSIGSSTTEDQNISITVDSDNSGADSLTLRGSLVGGAVTLLGGSDSNDTLIGPNQINTWIISALDTGTINGANFSSFPSLTGGSADDTFTFTGVGSLSGLIDGGAHTIRDTADYSGASGIISVTINTDIINIENLAGGGADNTLIADDLVNTWTITGVNDGTIDSLNYTDFFNLTGGTNDDNFVLSGGSVSGNLIGGTGNDSLTGNNINNTWNITGANSGTVNGVFSFSGIENLTGGTADDGFTINAGSISGTIDGGVGNDLLSPDNVANTWAITGVNTGTVTGVGGFVNVENINGRNSTDDFTFSDGASISGTVNGAGGNDSVNQSAQTGAVVVNLGGTAYANIEQYTGNGANSTLIGDNDITPNVWNITGPNDGTLDGITFVDFADLTGGTDIDTFTIGGGTVSGVIDGGGGNDTLVGGNVANTWDITAADAGDVTGIGSFVDIDNLTGNANVDTFLFADGSSLSGTVNGAANNDTVNFSAETGAVNVALGSSGYSNIETFIGNNTNSTIIGDNILNTWSITGANDGSIGATAFNNFNNITGGTNNDTFTIAGGSVSGTIDGNTGIDTILGDTSANTWNITGANAGNAANVNAFTDIENLTGNIGADDFVFANPGSLSGIINGASGSDSANYSAKLGAVTVNLTAGNYISIETLVGNNIDSTIVGENLASTWAITGINDGVVNTINFTDFNKLTGNSAVDSFVISGGSITGIIDGGGDNDTITGDNTATTWNITGADVGNSTDVSSFLNVETLQAGNGVDIFAFSNGSSFSGVINGGASSDTVDHSAQLGAVSIDISASNYFNIETFVGNNTSSTITGPAMANIWNITGGNSGDVSGVNYSGFNNLVGNSIQDQFVLSGGTISGSVDGMGGSDSIIADNLANTWSITGLDAGSVTGIGSFNSVENLTGGSLLDVFVFANTSSITGLIDGGGSNDTVDLSAEVGSVNVSLGAITYSSIESFIGNNVDSTLVGPLSNNTWTITGNNDGTVGAISFTNFNNLSGNVSTDGFIFQNGSAITGIVNGNAGTDTVDFSAEMGVVSVAIGAGTYTNIENYIGNNLSSTLTGQNVANTWTITGPNDGTVGAYTFANFNNLNGGSNMDNFTLNGGSITGNIDGGLGNDSLTPDNTANTWTIIGTDAGSVTGVSSFSSIENLAGSSGNDAFIFNDGSSISGTISGGTGSDSLNQSAQTGFVTVTLGAAGVSGVESFTGNGTNSTLVADNIVNTWILTGPDSGTISSIGFSGFSNLQGGSLDDSFSISGGSITGLVDGGAGNDLIVGDNLVNTWNITGADVGTVTGINNFADIETLTGNVNTDFYIFSSGSSFGGLINGAAGPDVVDHSSEVGAVSVSLAGGQYQNIESFIGNSANSTLTGNNTINNWIITSPNAGNVNGITFSGYNNITGNTGADTFTVQGGNITGTVNGGSGNDTLWADNISNVWNITSVDSGDVNGVAAFTNIDNLQGGTVVDVFNIGSDVSGTINGGSGDDAFNLGGMFSVGGVIAGGTGVDTLNGPALSSTWIITAADSGVVNGVSFSGTENITGGASSDAFTITNTGTAGISGTMNAGAGNDSLSLDYNLASSRVITFVGGAGTDSVTLTGTGGSITNSYVYGPASDEVAITTASGPTSQIVSATEIEFVTDMITADTIDLTGSNSNDTMVISPTGIAGLWPTSFQIGGYVPLAFSNKTNVILDGGFGTDTLRVDGTVQYPGNVDVTAEVITRGPAGLLGANILTINQANTIGTGINPLATNVNTLAVSGPTIDLYINETNGLAISAGVISGVLDVATVSGDITSAGTVNVTGVSSFTVGNGGSILLSDPANQFVGTPTFNSAGTITDLYLADNSAVDIQGLTISGDLTIAANGPISQTGPLTIGGTSDFSAGSNFINLSAAANDFIGTVTLQNDGAASTNIIDQNSLIFGTSSLGNGIFTVNAGSVSQVGGITQSANAGATNITATNGSIDLSDGSNDFTGTVSIVNSSVNNNATIRDSNDLTLGSSSMNGGDLVAVSASGMTLSGTTDSNNGDITLTANAGDIQLGRLNAGTGKITLNAISGNVLGNDSPITDPNLTSQNLEIIAGNAIGDFVNPISVSVPAGGTSLIVSGLPPAYIIGTLGILLPGSTLVNNVTSTTISVGQGQAVTYLGRDFIPLEIYSLPLYTMVDGGIKLPYRVEEYGGIESEESTDDKKKK